MRTLPRIQQGRHYQFDASMGRALAGADLANQLLVTLFDLLDDMPWPAGPTVYFSSTLRGDGTWTIIEPFACDSPEHNHSLLGRISLGTPKSMCWRAGGERIRKVLTTVGIARLLRVAQAEFSPAIQPCP